MSTRTPLDTERLSPNFDRNPPAAAVPAPAAPAVKKPPLAQSLTGEQIEQVKERIVAVLHPCFDPEIPDNIYELGLIYEIQIAPSGEVLIKMTLTSPACPVAGTLPGEVQRKVETVDNVVSAKIDLVWEPPWDKDRMSEAAKLQLGIDDW
jgi:FeS assembly SUF system protein